MSLFNMIVTLCPLLIYFVPHVLGGCQSYGVDLVNGGTYFINTNSTDDFSWISYFEGKIIPMKHPRPPADRKTITGCEPGDFADSAVILPDGDSEYCSSVPTTPNDTDVTAVW